MTKLLVRILPDANFGNVRLSINGVEVKPDTFRGYNLPPNSRLLIEAIPVKHNVAFEKLSISRDTSDGREFGEGTQNPSEWIVPDDNDVYRLIVSFR